MIDCHSVLCLVNGAGSSSVLDTSFTHDCFLAACLSGMEYVTLCTITLTRNSFSVIAEGTTNTNRTPEKIFVVDL